MITKKNRRNKIWADEGTDFAGEFNKFRSAETIKNYSTMNETEATFAERTIHSKTFCIATWRIMGTIIFISYLNLLQQ